MYIELRSRRFRDSDFRALHQRIVDALRTHDPLRVRKAVVEDITEAQGSTVAFNSAAAGHSHLPESRQVRHPVLESRPIGKTGVNRRRK